MFHFAIALLSFPKVPPPQSEGRDRKETSLVIYLTLESSGEKPKGWDLKALSVFLGHPWLLFLPAGCVTEELTPALPFPSSNLKGSSCSSMLVSLLHLRNSRRKCKHTKQRLLPETCYKIYASCETPLGKGFSSSVRSPWGVAKLWGEGTRTGLRDQREPPVWGFWPGHCHMIL